MPTYHWYVTPAVFAAAVSVVLVPGGTVRPAGCSVNCGTQTETVIVVLFETQGAVDDPNPILRRHERREIAVIE